MSWLGILRMGLVQASLGAVVVLVTSTLNRIMVVELTLPAIVPGALVALHYIVQVLRPLLGYGSDMGGRRTPWIVGGVALLGAGGVGAAGSVWLMAAHPALGIVAALVAYVAVGLGVGSAGTSLLALMAGRVAPRRRAAAATVVWLMMIAGIAGGAISAGAALDPFTPARLIAVMVTLAAIALAVSSIAVWRVEGAPLAAPPKRRQPFLRALRDVWDEAQARRFAIFVFVSMLAYSAQELVLEPFAGAVFAMTPGQTAHLTGLLHMGVLAGMAVVAGGTMLAGEYRGRAMRAWTMGGCVASALAALAIAGSSVAGPGAPLPALVVALGAANGAFSAAAVGAMIGLANQGRSAREGTRMGLWGAAQALAFAAGGLIGTGASDVARALIDAPGVAYAVVYGAEAALFMAAAYLATTVFESARPRSAAPAGAMPAR